MTVGTQMHQTLASLESACANLKTFALETEDKTAKKMFAEYSQQLDSICQGVKARCNYIEQQEPQYKVFDNAIQQGVQHENQQEKMNTTEY
ncbi:MAG TPA: DUF1657 domain-containing protein [Clostridia bacterium]|jgi:hypothetical protein|nr:DUF1657 domain-containing protein [Clostridia bacterium]